MEKEKTPYMWERATLDARSCSTLAIAQMTWEEGVGGNNPNAWSILYIAQYRLVSQSHTTINPLSK